MARRRILVPVLVGVALGLGALVACSPRPPGTCNVILISLDTLRADRLGTYGYPRGTSPSLDAFAERGVVFETAIAECSWTLPSHVTMLSGLSPRSHGVVLPTLRPSVETRLLAEILDDAGYATLGLTDGGYVAGHYGFDRGFDVFDDTEKGLAATLDLARAFVDSLPPDERFFLFLHTYDIHCPYTPGPEAAAAFRSEGAIPITTEGRCGNPEYNSMHLSPGQVRHVSDMYDAEIQEADRDLEPFLAFLSNTGRLEDTIVIITSDHGEEFGEHGQIGHERSLYRELVEIPLIVVAPGLSPAREARSAGLVDLTPTILDLVGVRTEAPFEGHALFGPDAPAPDTPRFSELVWKRRLRSVVAEDHHAVVNPDTDAFELYDWTHDRLERHDLGAERPDVAEALDALLDAHAAAPVSRRARPIEQLSEESRARLRALGYVN